MNSHSELSQSPVQDPSPSFLAASRMRLQEALESAEQGGWWSRLVFDPVAWLNQVRFAPALAAAIFIVGFAGGIGATYKMIKGPGPEPGPGPSGTATQASISGISSVSQVPGTNQVTVKYDVQVRDTVLEALMSDANPGVRIEALRLLQPVRGDSSVRIVLERLAAKDENRYIRSQARTLIGQLPEMN